MRFNQLLFFAAVSIYAVQGCSFLGVGASKPESPVLAEFEGGTITLEELKQEYLRTSEVKDSVSKQDLADFLPLYADYKLKIKEAEKAGLFSRDTLLVELETYEEQFAFPYWMRKEVEDALLQELIDRDQEVIKASHVLIQLPLDAAFKDTLKAYNKLIEARNEFLSGKSDMEELNKKYSSKSRGRSVGGELGYVNAGWAVKPFEDAAWNTPVGSISMPFRSKFGYHIVYVEDRKPKPLDKRFSHIFIDTNPDLGDLDERMAYAQRIFQEYRNGTPFDTLVVRHSYDKESIHKGGDIGWITAERNLKTQFTDSIMGMDKIGEVRPPFYSTYGVHIVKLDSIRNQVDSTEYRKEMLGKLKRLDRYRNNRQAVFEQTKSILEFEVYDRAYQDLLVFIDAENLAKAENLTLPDSLAKAVLFSSVVGERTLGDFKAYLLEYPTDLYKTSMMDRKLNDFMNEVKADFVIELTKQRFPEFAVQSRKYLEGLAIYTLTEDSVWNFAKADTALLKERFEESDQKYMLDTRYKYARIGSRVDSVIQQIKSEFESGDLEVDSVRSRYPASIVELGDTPFLEEKPYDNLKGLDAGQTSELFFFRARNNFMILRDVLPPRPMTFEEALPQVISDYQVEREKQWLERIRSDYSLTLYPEKIVPE